MSMRTATVILVLASNLMLPAAGRAETPPMTEEQRVLAVEDEYVAAEVSRDEATLRRLVDENFRYNSSDGSTTGKEAFIEGVLGMSMIGQTISERSVMLEGDIAFIFGTAELRFKTDGEVEATSILRYTAAYVKRQGQWRMLTLQMQRRAKP